MFPSWGISGAEMQAPTPLGLGQIPSALVSRSRLICHAYQLAQPMGLILVELLSVSHSSKGES